MTKPERRCSQCGRTFRAKPCGFTHAAIGQWWPKKSRSSLADIELTLAGPARLRLVRGADDPQAHYQKSVGRTPDGREVVIKLGVSGQVVGMELR